jgi:hypothetical protein
MEKTHVPDVIDQAHALSSIDNVISDLKSHIPLLPDKSKKYLKNYLQK